MHSVALQCEFQQNIHKPDPILRKTKNTNMKQKIHLYQKGNTLQH